jgi:aminocarboxymuconate-semialdehyde decarboxylase
MSGAGHGATDIHIHVTPPELCAHDGAPAPWQPRVVRDGAGHQSLVELKGRPMRSIVDELSELSIILPESAARGIDRLVISPWVSTLPLECAPGAAAEICRLQNAALARAANTYPGRVFAFGAVPLQDATLAAEVLAEALALGLVGAEITPSIANRWLGDPALEPFFAAAAEWRAPLFVHPGTHGLGLDVYGDYYLWNAVANPVETASAAAHLLMAGTLERHRDLIVVLAHGGGVLPAVVGRLERAFAVREEARQALQEGPRASFSRLHFDTVTHDRALLAALIAAVGADHVLLGSDHPFDMGLDDPVGDVRALGLSEAETALVLGENARALLEGVRRP